MTEDRNPGKKPTTLGDPGLTQAVLFVGWMPPALAALVAGLFLGLTTGNPEAAVVVVIGGTVVGYIACLTLLFSVGPYLERRGVGERIANGVVLLDIVVGVIAAIAIALLASISVPLALLATLVAVGFVVAVVAFLLMTDTDPADTPPGT